MPTLDAETRARSIVAALGGHWHNGYGMCQCPAHDDRTPSLRVKVGNSAILFRCFAGCSQANILAELKRRDLNDSRPVEVTASSATNDYRPLAEDMWTRASPLSGTKAEAYLNARGLTVASDELRYFPRAQLGPRSDRTYLPCLVARVCDERGFLAVQRTFLDPDRPVKASISQPKRGLGLFGKGAIRLHPMPGDTLRMAEGIEDALSVKQLRRVACWAAGGIERYVWVEIPDHIRHVAIYSQRGPEARDAI